MERPFAACDGRSKGARSKTEKYGRAAFHMVEDEVCRGFDGAAR